MHYSRWQRTGDPGPAGPRQYKKYQPCTVSGCANLIGNKGGRGLCTKHYQMWLLTGDPCGSTAITDAERFWPKVNKAGHEECWEWTASVDGNGYGSFHTDISTRAHRWAYLTIVGPVPDGHVLDHLCRNPSCVNPAHLEPVTNQENLARGWGRRLRNGMTDECINGHKYTPDNTYISPRGQQHCRACTAASRARYEQRKKAA